MELCRGCQAGKEENPVHSQEERSAVSWGMDTLLYGGRPRQVENQGTTCPHTFLRLLHLDLFPGKMGSANCVSVCSAFFILTIILVSHNFSRHLWFRTRNGAMFDHGQGSTAALVCEGPNG